MTIESYDKLVLSPGASPIRPAMPGIDLPGVFTVRTVPDVHAIREWLEGNVADPSGLDTYTGFQTVVPARRAVVVGGGFIGLEMAENLVHLGLDVTLIQRGPQLMAPMDPEMARYVERHVDAQRRQGDARATSVTGFRQAAGTSLEVLTESGEAIPADIVVHGHRRATRGRAGEDRRHRDRRAGRDPRRRPDADERARTSSPWATPSRSATTSRARRSHVPLAGPANRQGRIAAEVIAGRDSRFRGTQGTAIIGVFGGAAGLDRRQREDAAPGRRHRLREGLHLPELARRLLPGRAVPGDEDPVPASPTGGSSAPRPSAWTAWTSGSTRSPWPSRWGPRCTTSRRPSSRYAPQFGSAKSPVNFAGMVAADVLRGDMPVAHWDDEHPFLLDVRQPAELAVEQVPDVVNIPLPELRARLGRAAARSRDPRDLPLGPAGLLRDADPAPERVRRPRRSRAGCCRTPTSAPGRRPNGAGSAAAVEGVDALRPIHATVRRDAVARLLRRG